MFNTEHCGFLFSPYSIVNEQIYSTTRIETKITQARNWISTPFPPSYKSYPFIKQKHWDDHVKAFLLHYKTIAITLNKR